jgi:hypothetical protein
MMNCILQITFDGCGMISVERITPVNLNMSRTLLITGGTTGCFNSIDGSTIRIAGLQVNAPNDA